MQRMSDPGLSPYDVITKRVRRQRKFEDADVTQPQRILQRKLEHVLPHADVTWLLSIYTELG